MATRRQPLANLPNGNNSPYRAVAAAAGKRTRTQTNDLKEQIYGEPPSKKQIVEGHASRRPVAQPAQSAEDRLFSKKPTNAPATALERKLVAARETRQTETKAADKNQRIVNEKDLETIRQWQKHYRKVFPSFVFYFESLPEDIRLRFSKQVLSLGGREEKFFSKSVTHVITTRPVPAEAKLLSLTETQEAFANGTNAQGTNAQSRTINPSVLERTSDVPQKTRLAADMALQRRVIAGASNDILHKARDLGIKIWALEKFQRMMNTMFSPQIADPLEPAIIRPGGPPPIPSKAKTDADLSRLLQNEKKLNNAALSAVDIIPFKGIYIYIHDMDEQTRPVMVREYAKVPKEQGPWPQFHSVAAGKCPFVEDAAYVKRSKHQQLEKESKVRSQREGIAPRTRAATASQAAKTRGSTQQNEKALEEIDVNARRAVHKPPQVSQGCLDPPTFVPAKKACPDSMPPLLLSAQPNFRGLRQFHGGEPIASGVQPSHITSAIRSQMISSTAATAPGARAGTSKEVHQLQRKVLERSSRPPSANGMLSINDVRAAINAERDMGPARTSKKRLQEHLVIIKEEEAAETLSEDGNSKARQLRAPKKITQMRKEEEKDLKPGYCENCKDKYDDFDEHVVSRKHRKFALTAENWTELDALLAQLKRPEKDIS